MHPTLKSCFISNASLSNLSKQVFLTLRQRGGKGILFLSQWNRFWEKQQAWWYMSGMRWDKTRGARALGQPALPCWDTNTALACSPALFKHTQTTAANLSQHVQHCMCVHLLLVWLRFYCVCTHLCVCRNLLKKPVYTAIQKLIFLISFLCSSKLRYLLLFFK